LNANGEKYTEEQKMFVDNILFISPKQYTELLAVGEGASEDEIRGQYKKVFFFFLNINYFILFYFLSFFFFCL